MITLSRISQFVNHKHIHSITQCTLIKYNNNINISCNEATYATYSFSYVARVSIPTKCCQYFFAMNELSELNFAVKLIDFQINTVFCWNIIFCLLLLVVVLFSTLHWTWVSRLSFVYKPCRWRFGHRCTLIINNVNFYSFYSSSIASCFCWAAPVCSAILCSICVWLIQLVFIRNCSQVVRTQFLITVYLKHQFRILRQFPNILVLLLFRSDDNFDLHKLLICLNVSNEYRIQCDDKLFYFSFCDYCVILVFAVFGFLFFTHSHNLLFSWCSCYFLYVFSRLGHNINVRFFCSFVSLQFQRKRAVYYVMFN